MIREFAALLSNRIEQPMNFMQVVVGPRQVGKTTGVKHIFDNWPGNKIMDSADLPVPPKSDWIEMNWQKARLLSKDSEVLLILDEIQKIPRWSETVKKLFDQDRASKKIKVILLGSASIQISTGLNDSLAGRFEKIDVPHWSYTETQKAFNWDLNQYMMFGGYPGPSDLINDSDRWQQFIRDSIIEPAISRDIFGLVQIRNPALFRQTFELASLYPAQNISYQKILGQLQDRGSLATVKHYLYVLEEAFLIKTLSKYSASSLSVKSSSPKILPLCPALPHAFKDPQSINKDPIWRGRIFELIVGIELCRRYKNVYYWNEGDSEVDYVINDKDNNLIAIEVKSSRTRKLSGLSKFCKKFPNAFPLVISMDNIFSFFEKKNLFELQNYA